MTWLPLPTGEGWGEGRRSRESLMLKYQRINRPFVLFAPFPLADVALALFAENDTADALNTFAIRLSTGFNTRSIAQFKPMRIASRNENANPH